MSTNLTYLSMARHRLNLTIRSGVLGHRILFDGDRAVGVEAESGEDIFRVYGREIILSGGTINSPQLLMLSGVGPREHLESLDIPVLHDLPGVGENLRDHPAAFMLFSTNLENPPAGSPSIQVGMRYTTPGSPHRNDMQMTPILLTSEHRPTAIPIPEGEAYTGFSVALQKSVTAGRITLVSADPRAHPHLDYRYLSDAWDRERMRSGVRACIDLTQSSPSPMFSKSGSTRPTTTFPVTMRSTHGCWRTSEPSTTRLAPARWVRHRTRWQWWTST